jgi:hypothetical protein
MVSLVKMICSGNWSWKKFSKNAMTLIRDLVQTKQCTARVRQDKRLKNLSIRGDPCIPPLVLRSVQN